MDGQNTTTTTTITYGFYELGERNSSMEVIILLGASETRVYL